MSEMARWNQMKASICPLSEKATAGEKEAQTIFMLLPYIQSGESMESIVLNKNKKKANL